MKFKDLFIVAWILCFFVACSDDNNSSEGGPDDRPDASLSLRIRVPQIGTKATGDAEVKRLYVAVFQRGGDNDGKLLVAREAIQTGTGNLDTIEDLAPLKAGDVSILLVANAAAGTFDNFSTIDAHLSAVQRIGNEDPDSPSMGSGVLQFTLQTGSNAIGMSGEGVHVLSNAPITLYRNFSRIYLGKLMIKPDAEYAENASFNLKHIFMANVKNYSHYLSSYDWGNVEVTDQELPDYMLCGAAADLEGEYKQGPATLDTHFLHTYDDGFRFPGSDGVTIGDYADQSFYVYENMQEETNHTLLVIEGTYQYTDTNGHTRSEDGFYTVIVNRKHDQISNVVDHLYVKRNVVYHIDVALKGPGSDSPYDPKSLTTLTVAVDVAAWGKVTEDPEID